MSARPAAFAPTRLPRHIGKYRVTGLIGEGAMGVVYRAQDPDIQRTVAIKTIRPPLRRAEHNGGTPASRQFRLEAQAAGRLHHPNIVSIYECGDYGEDGEELFIAMECIEGPSLAAPAQQGARLPLPDVMAVMLQVLDALQCAHEQRVWHCDIKPSNLLVAPDGRIKITDFGIARVESADMTLRNALWGSPGYMAPERYAGGAIDQRVDLFACGVLLYELLTGSPPFVGSASSIMYQVLQQQAARPSTLPDSAAPPALDAVVARALAKRPSDRYASAQEMRTALLAATASVRTPRMLSRGAITTLQEPASGPQSSSLPRPASTEAVQLATVCVTPLPDVLRDGPSRVQRALPPQVPTVVAQGLPLQSASMLAGPAEPAIPRGDLSSPAKPDLLKNTIGLDTAALARIELLLRPCLGPMSRIVVREAARRSRNIAEVVARVADGALSAEERAVFVAEASSLPGMASAAGTGAGGASGASGASGAGPRTGVELPVLGQNPLKPEIIDKAARMLAQQVGPIAMLLARRAAAGADSREQFFCRLAESAGEMIDPKAMLSRLWRIE